MADFPDAVDLQRLRDIFSEHTDPAGRGKQYLDDRFEDHQASDDADWAERSLFGLQDPPSSSRYDATSPNPFNRTAAPIVRFAGGGTVDDPYDDNARDDLGEGRFTRSPAERRVVRERSYSQHQPAHSEEWERFLAHRGNPLSYGMEALSRLDNRAGAASQGEHNIYTMGNVADLVAPNHELGDKYGVPGMVGDALNTTANMIPGLGMAERGLSGVVSPIVHGAMRTPDALSRIYGWSEKGSGYADGGKVSKIIKQVEKKFGSYQASRMERAADETNLERIHPEGLKEMFNPRNSGLFMNMPPGDFQDYAARIPNSASATTPYPRAHNVPGSGRMHPEDMTQDWYLDNLAKLMETKGAYASPELHVGKNLDDLTNVFEHEGRHRAMAMDRMGDPRMLTQVKPTGRAFGWSGMEPAEQVDWLTQKYFPHKGGTLVVPEGFDISGDISKPVRDSVVPRLPRPIYSEPYAAGGAVPGTTSGPLVPIDGPPNGGGLSLGPTTAPNRMRPHSAAPAAPIAAPSPAPVAAGGGNGADTGGVGGSATDGSGGSAAAGVGGEGTYADGGYVYFAGGGSLAERVAKLGWREKLKDAPALKNPGSALNNLIEHTQREALVAKTASPDGGFTWQPGTNEQPTKGYAVSPYPERGKVFEPGKFSPGELLMYKGDNADLLRDPTHHIGAWNDPETGKVHLDISVVHPEREAAEALAKQYNQKAIFDFENMTSIPTGGTGSEKPGFAGGGPLKFVEGLAKKFGSASEAAANMVRAKTEKTGREYASQGTADTPLSGLPLFKGEHTRTEIPDQAMEWMTNRTDPFFTVHSHPVLTPDPIWKQDPRLSNIKGLREVARLHKEGNRGALAYPSGGDLRMLRMLNPDLHTMMIEAAGSPDSRVAISGDKDAINRAVEWSNRDRSLRTRPDVLNRLRDIHSELGLSPDDRAGYSMIANDAFARSGMDVSMDAAARASNGMPYDQLLDAYKESLGSHMPSSWKPGYADGGPVHMREGGIDLLKKAARYLNEPRRVSNPGIYKAPDQLVTEAREHMVPDPGKEGPMHQLFGHTRDSLDELAQGDSQAFDIRPKNEQPPFNLSGTAAISPQVLTRRNANRLVNSLGEALEDPQMKLTRSWYELSPLWDRMKKLGMGDKDMQDLNVRMAVMSAGSDPKTEINRGLYANWLAKQGRLEDFIRHAGTAAEERGSDFPADMEGVMGHAYHGTAQVPNLLDYENTGRLWPAKHKVPTYAAATDPRFPYSARPIADSHFNRILGFPDVSTAATDAVRQGVPSGTQYSDLVPWFNKNVADRVGLRPRDAQALLWNLGGPQTGVRYIGPSKLEMIAGHMDQVAKERGIAPELARDKLLTGEIGGATGGHARGGPVDDFNLFQSQNYRKGGEVSYDRGGSDFDTQYQSQYFKRGGFFRR